MVNNGKRFECSALAEENIMTSNSLSSLNVRNLKFVRHQKKGGGSNVYVHGLAFMLQEVSFLYDAIL